MDKTHLNPNHDALNDTAMVYAGAHSGDPERGMCIMEAVAYISGENLTDHPLCADGSFTEVMININDHSSDSDRMKLLPLINQLVGSRTISIEEQPILNADRTRAMEEASGRTYRDLDDALDHVQAMGVAGGELLDEAIPIIEAGLSVRPENPYVSKFEVQPLKPLLQEREWTWNDLIHKARKAIA